MAIAFDCSSLRLRQQHPQLLAASSHAPGDKAPPASPCRRHRCGLVYSLPSSIFEFGAVVLFKEIYKMADNHIVPFKTKECSPLFIRTECIGMWII
jgi:hypothetical protein